MECDLITFTQQMKDNENLDGSEYGGSCSYKCFHQHYLTGFAVEFCQYFQHDSRHGLIEDAVEIIDAIDKIVFKNKTEHWGGLYKAILEKAFSLNGTAADICISVVNEIAEEIFLKIEVGMWPGKETLLKMENYIKNSTNMLGIMAAVEITYKQLKVDNATENMDMFGGKFLTILERAPTTVENYREQVLSIAHSFLMETHEPGALKLVPLISKTFVYGGETMLLPNSDLMLYQEAGTENHYQLLSHNGKTIFHKIFIVSVKDDCLSTEHFCFKIKSPTEDIFIHQDSVTSVHPSEQDIDEAFMMSHTLFEDRSEEITQSTQPLEEIPGKDVLDPLSFCAVEMDTRDEKYEDLSDVVSFIS